MKRKTCASVLALVLTCAMVTGSLPVEANAAEATAASELTAVQDENQEQETVTGKTSVTGDETVGEQEQVTEPVQEEVKQEEQTTEPGQEEVKQEEQTTESVQEEAKQEKQTTESAPKEVKKQEEQVTESAPKEETQEEQITEPTADQAAQEEQAAPVAAEAADSVKYLKDIQVYETLYWTGSANELRDPLKMEQCGEDEYNLYLYDNQWIGPFALVNLAEDAPEDTVITASWYHLFMEEQNSEELTSGNYRQLSGIMTVSNGTLKTSDITVTASSKTTGKSQEVTIHILTVPCLEGLSIVDGSGEKVAVDGEEYDLFSRYGKDKWNSMTATTKSEKVVVTANPKVTNEACEILYNGATANEFSLNAGENPITISLKNKAGVTNTYKITITREAEQKDGNVSFETDPEDALVVVKDKNGDRIWPDHDKTWTLEIGETYSYTVTKKGYIGQKNNFVAAAGTAEITLQKAKDNKDIDKTIYAQWGNFRNGDDELGITTSKTPYNPDDAELLWAVKYGSGWAAAPGSPIIVDGDLVTYTGSTIRKLDRNTGAIVAEGTMVGSSSFSIVPATYGDGMIFVGLSNGRIQAFNAKDLTSLWVYQDDLKGQPNCPITYKDGYIYAGFWNSETKDANFVCISVTDEDPSKTTEEKVASWTYKRAGGFYWAGAYVTDKFAVVGTDDGASGYSTEGASLLVFDRETGEVVDSWDGIRGDIRSNVSHDPESDRVFFTSKGGVLCNAQIDWETGEITDKQSVVIADAQGNTQAMSTCTPSVYNGRIYIGISGKSQFGANSGHAIGVYDLNDDGSMTQAYAYAIVGYPQTSAMVTTGYADEDGYVYIYLPYNYTPGGVSVLKDKKGQTEPLTTTDSGYSEVFTPVSPLAQYCICSTIADEYGTLYYKNDSCYMMAITSKVESIKVTEEPTSITESNGTVTAEGLKVVSNLKNGEQRDISDYVKVTKQSDGTYLVTYTYGFDNANYGLKTLTTTFGEATVIFGDVNGDQEVDVNDAILVYAYVNGKAEFTEDQLNAADVNGDGEVDVNDAILVYAYVNGKITKFPVEK